MLIPDRRRRILDEVRRQGSASVEQLADALGVSGSTVRRDLAELQRQGVLARAHGGAVVAGEAPDAAPTGRPGGPPTAGAVKARIGTRAAELVEEDSTIMMLAGSTTAAMVPALYRRRLTVVTNGLDIAHALRHAPNVALMVLGGYLHREQMTMLGPMTEAAMSALHVDVMFGGAWGIDAETGVTGHKIIQAGDHQHVLRHADRLVILADAGKVGRRGPTLLAGIDRVHTLVTDRDAPRSAVAAIAARGVTVDQV